MGISSIERGRRMGVVVGECTEIPISRYVRHF